MKRRRKKKKTNHILLLIPAAVLVAVLIFFGQYVTSQVDRNIIEEIGIPSNDATLIVPVRSTHAHVDFKVFMGGDEVSFNKEEFSEANRFVHVHIGNANGDKIIHVHSTNISIGDFFTTLGMEFNSECFILETDESFCNDDEKKLKFFVNGEENSDFGNYVMQDLDRILVTYGSDENQIQEQIEKVTDFSCIFSGQCPDRQSELIIPKDAPDL